MDTSYTWHINDYDGLIFKSRRMLSTAKSYILVLIWPEEMNVLHEDMLNAERRGIKAAIIHYGATNLKIRQLYQHPGNQFC